MNEAQIAPRIRPISRRIFILLVLVIILLILGFHTVTDSARLEHNALLDASDYAGYAVCHRITDRSFSLAGRQLPLCARCTGMYLGVVVAFVVLGLAGRHRWALMPPLRVVLGLIFFIVLMGIDGLNSYSHFFETTPHLYEPQNWLRLVTGTGAGLTMGIILFPAVAQTLWRHQEQKASVGSLRELAGLVVVAGLTIMLVLTNQPTILYVLGLVSAAGVILVLAAVNSTMLLILTKRDSRALTLRQTLLPLGIGVILGMIQIGVISFLRYSLTGTLTGFPGIA